MKALFHHVMDVVAENGVYYPRRFTEKQTEALSTINEWFGRNSRSAAGMALKGYTTAKTVSFSYHGQLHCSSMGGFDFYENGLLVDNIKITEDTLETEAGLTLFAIMNSLLLYGFNQNHYENA